MSVIDWLLGLNEAYMIAWANKGLLRRGRKLLQGEETAAWLLTAARAEGEIGGLGQRLEGVGFDHLHCDCAAVGPCHHLVAFLLGLQQKAGTLETERGAASTESAASAEEAAGAAAASPWLMETEAEREKQLGKGPLARALRWHFQGIVLAMRQDAQGLSAEVWEKEAYQVQIPRAGGMEASLCSCKKTRCAHRALVVIRACVDAGCLTLTPPPAILAEAQQVQLARLEAWLQGLILQGMSGLSSLQLNQGETLVTELKQADLPAPAGLLSGIIGMLRQARQRALVSSPQRLRPRLAKLLAYTHALQRVPMPQPMHQLAGEHRRQYRLVTDLILLGLGIELWQTLSGHHGYTLHCYSPDKKRYFTLSEARKPALAPDWQPEQALRQARFAQCGLRELVQQRFVLTCAWVSGDGRLSPREGTCLTGLQPYPVSSLLAWGTTVARSALALAAELKRNPYQTDLQPYGIVALARCHGVEFDRYRQQWCAVAEDLEARSFNLTVGDNDWERQAAEQLKSPSKNLLGIFGRWYLDNGAMAMAPIAMIFPEHIQSLTDRS